MRRLLSALLTLPVILFVCAVAASAAVPDTGFHGPRWSLGPLVATYAGPSHADLLFRTNDIMAVLSGEPGTRMADFETGTPAGMRAYWAFRPALGLAATYSFSSYSSAETFKPLQWDSMRELSTDLHELDFSVHYGLDFVRNQKILPYVGFGIGFVMADTNLRIELHNAPGTHVDDDDPNSPLLPDQRFDVGARDTTIAYLGLAGLLYRFGNRLALNAEMQAVMGDIRQTFDYAGSLQHIRPETEQNAIDDWGSNDILGGSYPMDLNGVRLSIGLLVGL